MMRKVKASWDKRVKIEPIIGGGEEYKVSGQKRSVLQFEPDYGENISIWENATSLADVVRKMRRGMKKSTI